MLIGVQVHSRTKHAACMTMIVLMNEGAALGTVVGQLFGRGEWGHVKLMLIISSPPDW